MYLYWFLKNPKLMDELSSLGYFSHNLKILILKIIVVLCIPSLLTSVINFSLSLNFLKTLPWWYAIRIMPFFFVRIILSHSWITYAAFSGSSTSWTFLVNSPVSMVSFITRDSMSFLLISSWVNFLAFYTTNLKHLQKQKKCYA